MVNVELGEGRGGEGRGKYIVAQTWIGFCLASDFLRRQRCVPDKSLCVVNQK